MDQAIGSKIADYLIKPVHPNQILLSLKKNIHKRDIVTAETDRNYRESFASLSASINDSMTADDSSPESPPKTATSRRPLSQGNCSWRLLISAVKDKC